MPSAEAPAKQRAEDGDRPPKGESPYLADTDENSVPEAEAPDGRRAEDGNHQGMSPTSDPSAAGKKTSRSLSKATAQPGPTAPSLAGTKRRILNALVAPVTDNRGEAWQKWIDFCDEVSVNPLLEAFADKVPIL